MTHQVQFPGLGLELTVNEVAFSIGSFQVRWYGIIIAVGFLLAVGYASRSSKKMNIDMNHLIDAVIVGLLAAIVCARLFYVVFYPGDYYWKNPGEILKIHEGGLAIYGGLIGATVFGGLTAKLRKLRVPAVLDIASLGYLIGQGIGRWGNFINQEAFGTVTALPWGMLSDNTRLVVPDSPVHPCFLYESLLCATGFVLLHLFTRRLRRYDGQTFLLYIVWYGACRFFIEGLRTDSLIIPGTALRVSQVIAAGCVLVGVCLLIAFRHRTSLSGCGSAKVMEGVGLGLEEEQEKLLEDQQPKKDETWDSIVRPTNHEEEPKPGGEKQAEDALPEQEKDDPDEPDGENQEGPERPED